ncbi:hypothetical protein RZN22_17920 [Bacillaceae bacterium S4-13-58]
MEVAKTLGHKITNHSRIFDETLFIYNEEKEKDRLFRLTNKLRKV